MEQADMEPIQDRMPTVVFWSVAVPCMFCCLRDTDQVKGFLSPDGMTKVMISRSSFMKELVAAFPEGVPVEPTLKEKMDPWEKQKDPYMAWIVPNKTR